MAIPFGYCTFGQKKGTVMPKKVAITIYGFCRGHAKPAIAEPPQWTWGVVQERLISLSEASGKSVEKILLAVCKQAAEERQEDAADECQPAPPGVLQPGQDMFGHQPAAAP